MTKEQDSNKRKNSIINQEEDEYESHPPKNHQTFHPCVNPRFPSPLGSNFVNLNLSLSPPSPSTAYHHPPPLPPPQPPLPPPGIPPPPPHDDPHPTLPCNPKNSRQERSPSPPQSKSQTIPIPYPWATDKRATVHSMEDLLHKGINTISGEIECKKCERRYKIEYDVQEKFKDVAKYLLENMPTMHHRAPSKWMNPTLIKCDFCDRGKENSCKPVISSKKRSINWLFLMLGEFLGCCTLKQLKYFCKHTTTHRTGAKDRVLYLAYLVMCKQLDPKGPFDYHASR